MILIMIMTTMMTMVCADTPTNAHAKLYDATQPDDPRFTHTTHDNTTTTNVVAD